MTEHKYLTLMEAVAFGIQEGNETLLPFALPLRPLLLYIALLK
jgi:hypothetical protein